MVDEEVVIQLTARFGEYERRLAAAERMSDIKFNGMANSAEHMADRMERAIRGSSSRTSSAIRGLAGSLAAAFSVREAQQMADGYTRFTNQLKVAGLEGEAVAQTQERLFQTAQRYGVELESLGTLFSRGAQVSKELGASQEDLLKFTNGVAAALKVQGASAAQSQGALLQLSQALGSGVVRAEEFNSINEGALPILKAVAANLDGAGGSVARLKNMVNDGKVTSDAFFRAFLKGSADLEAQAAKSSLTIGNAFTVLNNALGKYIGEADQSVSATQRIASGIESLADNLDTVVTALSIISTVMIGRFAASMAAGAASTVGASTAMFALQARAVGAATTMEALAITSRAAGASMLAAFGGPVGLAVAALTAGVIYFATRTKESGEAALDLAIANRQASKAEEEHKKVLSDLTTKMGEGAKATRDAAKASREKAQADLVQAKAALKAALAEREKAAAQAKSAMNTARTQTGVGEDRRFTTLGVGVIGRTGIAKADAAAVEAKADIATLERRIRELDDGLTSPALPSSTSGGKADKGKSKKPTGPTAEEIEARFQSELANEIQRTLSARRNLAVTAEEQAALERQALDNAVRQYEAETRANKEYTDGQKAQLIEQARETAALEHLRISRDEREAIEQRALEARRENDRYEHDALQAQADLADTRKDSLAAERRILDWMEQREQAELEAAIAAGKIADAAKARADLETMQGARRQRTERDHESPLGRYQRDLESFDYDDAREQAAVDAMDRLGDSVANTATQYLKLGGIAGDVINGLIKDLVRLAIQQTIVKSIVGGVSKIFEIFGASTPSSASFPGFDPSKIPGYGGVMSIRNAASGTDFAHGGIYRVGEAGPETVMLPRGARVIPNTNMAAAGRNVTNVTQVLRLDLSNAVLTPELLAQMNQMAQGAAVGGAMAGSNLAQNSMSRRARNRIP